MREHAELCWLLNSIATYGELRRMTQFKDKTQQLEEASGKDAFVSMGLFAYPVLQAADILIYRAMFVPVGEDQIPHIEITREIARRYNHIYGREPGFEEKAEAAVKKMGSKKARLYDELRTRYLQDGDEEALESARALLADTQNLSIGDRERLFGYLENKGKVILVEPQALLTEASRMPGLDGQKMSKSYGNGIFLREEPAAVTKKVRGMPTDPARVRRTDWPRLAALQQPVESIGCIGAHRLPHRRRGKHLRTPSTSTHCRQPRRTPWLTARDDTSADCVMAREP